ncbi:MAG: ECF transporter S component [Candidatus Improbicoccus pseudotrichonymphae]|uniref:ECF transporter S component n=1 Tax=Candidatus Improbicoccus pseudotrichonymphae TaxID=3033792 RepID=A0AA48I4X8_9FIRM|nr:MAG: ECF transporter S component [Candidatus Improbicoccus pseudotrichonymphae]
MRNTNNKTNILVINAFLSMFSLLSVAFDKMLSAMIPIPFFRLEFSDIPAYVSIMMFGDFKSGMLIIIIVSFLRAVFFSIAGWVGFIMRALSVILIFFLFLHCKCKERFSFFLILGTLLYVIAKVPFSMLLWVHVNRIPILFFRKIIPCIVISNILRIILNYFLSIYVYKLIMKAKNTH